jgi:serine/threonine-protein kinase RsbW
VIALELPADLLALRVISPWLRGVLAYGDDPDAETSATKLELALQELCVNVIEHAYNNEPGGRIRLTYTRVPNGHEFAVRDQGAEYDPHTRREVDLAVPTVGGYGLHLMESLCDDVQYRREGADNVWTLRLLAVAPVAD